MKLRRSSEKIIFGKTPEEQKAIRLYQELSSARFAQFPFEKRLLGEGMVLVNEAIWQYWKPRYLLDTQVKCAYEIMDRGMKFVSFSPEDIDWPSLRELPRKAMARAEELSAEYPSFIRGFSRGVAEVSWQLHPDGRYFMDEDGYGTTDDEEITLYGFIDRKMNVLVKFRYIDDDSGELRQMRKAAEAIVKNQRR